MQVLLGKMGTRSRVLYLIACLLTAAIYPKLMDRILLDFNPVVVAMLNVRNLMMIFILTLARYCRKMEV